MKMFRCSYCNPDYGSCIIIVGDNASDRELVITPKHCPYCHSDEGEAEWEEVL